MKINLINCNIYAGGLGQSYAGSLVVGSLSASLLEPTLVGAVSFLVVPMTPLGSAVLPSCLPQDSRALPNVWPWISVSATIGFW